MDLWCVKGCGSREEQCAPLKFEHDRENTRRSNYNVQGLFYVLLRFFQVIPSLVHQASHSLAKGSKLPMCIGIRQYITMTQLEFCTSQYRQVCGKFASHPAVYRIRSIGCRSTTNCGSISRLSQGLLLQQRLISGFRADVNRS